MGWVRRGRCAGRARGPRRARAGSRRRSPAPAVPRSMACDGDGCACRRPARSSARAARRARCGYGRSSRPSRPVASHSQAASICRKRSGRRNASQRSSRRMMAAASSFSLRVDVGVLARRQQRELAAVHRHAQALVDAADQLLAARLVADVARQHVGGRRALAEVVHQAGVAHRQRLRRGRAAIQHHQRVHAGVDLRDGAAAAAARRTARRPRASAGPARRRCAAPRTCAPARAPSARATAPATRVRPPARRPRRPPPSAASARWSRARR